jgi:hypothetical protein
VKSRVADAIARTNRVAQDLGDEGVAGYVLAAGGPFEVEDTGGASAGKLARD